MAPLKKPRLPKSQKDRPGPRRPISPRPVQSTWYLLALFLVLALVQTYLFMPSGRTIPYSEFKTLVAQDKVAEVTVNDQSIRGQLKDSAADAKSRAFVVTRVEDPKLVEELEAHKVKFTGEVASHWSDLLSWVLPLLLIIGISSFFFRRMSSAEGGVMSFARSRGKIYAEDDVKVTFTDVAGVEEAEDELKEIVEFLRTPRKYTQLGGRIPKGVLLVGPPGTGKTLLARAVAGEAHVPFFSLSGSEFVEMFVGVGAARVRDLFQQAETKAPCIVFIDELDALGKARVQSPLGSHEEREQTLNQLLAEMDGFDARKGVIIMAATNRPEVLDPALLRPGRFDRQVLVDKPDVKGREAILAIHARGVKIDPAVDLKIVAARTAGFAGADLANLVNEAALLAARRNKQAVDMVDLEDAKDKVMLGLERKSMVLSEEERKLTAYHEAGHALVSLHVPGADPIHKVTIVPRGRSLGVTHWLPEEDRHNYTKQFILSHLATAYGGRVAEELVFGPDKVTTGAAQDIQQATDMARRMITQFGMSDVVGPIAVGDREAEIFLGREVVQRREISEHTAEVVDDELKRILGTAFEQARQILIEHRDALDRLAAALLERETLDRDQVQLVVDGKTLPPVTPTPPLVPAEARKPAAQPLRGGPVLGNPPPEPAGA